jgi:ribonuclease H2 subunit B
MDSDNPSVLIFHEEAVPPNGITLLTLPHPKDSEDGVLFCQSGAQIYELQSVQPRKFGSWFIDERISSDSSYLMASKFDPKFLVLPFLEKATKFSPLDQIVTYVEGCDRIPLQYQMQWNMGDICDVNDQLGDDMILYRMNKDKTLAWLRSKVDITALYLCKKRVKLLATQVSTFNVGAQSSQGTLKYIMFFNMICYISICLFLDNPVLL